MDVDLRQVNLEVVEEQRQAEPKFDMAAQFLPTGGQVYKVVKYLNLAANIEIILVSYPLSTWTE